MGLLGGKELQADVLLEDVKKEMGGPMPSHIHLLVVVPKNSAADPYVTRDEDIPPLKRVKHDQKIVFKHDQKIVVYQGPVSIQAYSIPMKTIEAYQKLQKAFLSNEQVGRLCFLHGPRQFGKTTIGVRLRELIATDPSVLVIFQPLTPLAVETEQKFWLALSRNIGEETSSSQEFESMFVRHKKRLWLVLDEMNAMLTNEELTSNFMHCLRKWQTSPYFLGFLGIGTNDLVNIHLKFERDVKTTTSLGEVVQAKRFSVHQMSDFFKLIEESYPFRDSTRQAIIEYSAGAPGVFGSLIRYSIECDQCDQEQHEWEHWFKIKNFYNYLNIYNWTYDRIRKDLEDLSQSDWKLVTLLLKDDASGYGAKLDSDPATLLRMGVVIVGVDGTTLEFVSLMMRRLCLETLPIREIKQVVNVDDPLELLAYSLRFMDVKSFRHGSVTNKLFPSKSVFQCELYASIRGIFKANGISNQNVLAEARDFYDKQSRRLDIIINSEEKYAYDLKSNLLDPSEIEASVREADDFRQLLDIGTMYMVNFVPRGRSILQPVHNVEEYPKVKVIHVFFPDTCDEYTLHFEGSDGNIVTHTIR